MFALVWTNFTRKKGRLSLTLLSVLIAFLLFGMLMATRQVLRPEVGGAVASRLMTIQFAVTPYLFSGGIILALIMGFIGSLFPAIRAARLPITRRGGKTGLCYNLVQTVDEECLMRENISVSLPEKLKAELDRVSHLEGVSRSDVLREALRDYLFVKEFRALRTRMVAQAQANGIFTDEDVFNRVS